MRMGILTHPDLSDGARSSRFPSSALFAELATIILSYMERLQNITHTQLYHHLLRTGKLYRYM